MATPSSGAISWSQIQAETGGAYSMSNFNSVTGRGYDASDYYNYPPATTCYQFYVYDYGLIDFTDCYGVYQSDYFFPGAGFCAWSAVGPCYIIGTCEF
jgi:hypothetical protein